MNHCKNPGCCRPLQKFNEMMMGTCEKCMEASVNFDRRSWMDGMFMDSKGGECGL